MKLYQTILDDYKPEKWEYSHYSSEVTAVELSPQESEYLAVQLKIKSTLKVDLSKVVRVENPFAWGMYELKKAEYRARENVFTEAELFHCTSVDNIKSIITDNLDWRRSKRTKYGKGVSFSPSASYANIESKKSIGSYRATILAKVLVGPSCKGSYYLTIPPHPRDTSVGNRDQVYVKYADHEFYPAYVAYYTTPPIVYGQRRYYM